MRPRNLTTPFLACLTAASLTAVPALAQQPESQSPDKQPQQNQTERRPNQPQQDQPQQDQAQQDQSRQNGSQVVLGIRIDESPTTGVLVRDVMPGGPAEKAGLRQNDYILSIDGKKISSPEEFDRILSQVKPGTRTQLEIWRKRQKQQLAAMLVERQSLGFRPDADGAGAREGFDTEQRDQQAEAWLGVALEEAAEGQEGVRIERVYPSGPAARAGLYSGDVVVAIDGKAVKSPEEFVKIVQSHKPGEQIEFALQGGEQQRQITATLANRFDYFIQPGSPPGGERGYRGDFSDEGEIPEHAMMLEQHRRFAEQHQRIEERLDRVLEELQALRQQLGVRPGAKPGAQPQGGQGAGGAQPQNR